MSISSSCLRLRVAPSLGASPLPQPPRPKTLEEALALNDVLLAYIRKLGTRIDELERRLGHNSRNSSRPPSIDPPGLKHQPKKPPSGRKPSGQPGHQGHQRVLVPSAQVDCIAERYRGQCGSCARKLDPRRDREVGDPVGHQVTEIPEVTLNVADHRCHALECRCGHVTLAPLPVDVPEGAFGPRLQATDPLGPPAGGLVQDVHFVLALLPRRGDQGGEDLMGPGAGLRTVAGAADYERDVTARSGWSDTGSCRSVSSALTCCGTGPDSGAGGVP